MLHLNRSADEALEKRKHLLETSQTTKQSFPVYVFPREKVKGGIKHQREVVICICLWILPVGELVCVHAYSSCISSPIHPLFCPYSLAVFQTQLCLLFLLSVTDKQGLKEFVKHLNALPIGCLLSKRLQWIMLAEFAQDIV